jgi:hypothetical protein
MNDHGGILECYRRHKSEFTFTRVGLDDVEKRKFLTLPGFELRPLVVQPVASRYTDYVIPAPFCTVASNLIIIRFSDVLLCTMSTAINFSYIKSFRCNSIFLHRHVFD